MRLVQFLALLVIGRGLRSHVLAILPLPETLRGCGRGAILAFTRGSFSGSECGSWCRCAACDATRRGWVRMVLIWALVPVPWGSCSVLDNGSDLRWWARHTPIGRQLAWALTGRAIQPRWGRRRWRGNATSQRAIVWIRNTVRWLRLLLMRRRLLLRLRCLRCELRRRRMIWARGDMMRFRRW